MNLLCIDIGGTFSRFGSFIIADSEVERSNKPFKVPTTSEKIFSLDSLIDVFNTDRPDGYLHGGQYDLIVLSVAGPVMGRQCSPPNIRWAIDLNTFTYKDRTMMINDFVAQAYGLVHPSVASQLVKVRDHGKSFPDGNIAVIGPGTGLGHCCLVGQGDAASSPFLHIPSEAGHAAFAFHGKIEKALEQYILGKKGIDFCASDDVISGSGLALIHEFLTNESIDPFLIDEHGEKFRETMQLFSRLFGRACKNYCLAVLATQSLIITGGVAIHHPGMVSSTEFYDAFVDSRHRHILTKINIYLNPGIETGLLGGAYFGMNTIMKKHSPR